MKLKAMFIIVFSLSVFLMIKFGNKDLTVYSRSINEKLPAEGGRGYFVEPITKTYHENYGAIGGAIGFGIIAGASLIGIALIQRRVENDDSA